MNGPTELPQSQIAPEWRDLVLNPLTDYSGPVQRIESAPVIAAQFAPRPPITVKPLVWERKTYGSADCSTASINDHPLYTVDRLNATCWMMRGWFDPPTPAAWPGLPSHGLYDTLEAARAAAAAEWEAFIRAAVH